MSFEDGDLVLVNYTGKSDGEVFDTTIKEDAEESGIQREDMNFDPIPVLVGGGYVIEGFEEAVADMEEGDERDIEVPSEKGYGSRSSDNVETYPEKEFEKQGVQVHPGEEIMVGNRRGRVVSKGSGRIRIDFNHPLAGKDLEYHVEVVEEVEDDEEKAEYIFSYRVGEGEVEFEDDTVVLPASHQHGDHEHEIPENIREEVREEILENTGFDEVVFE